MVLYQSRIDLDSMHAAKEGMDLGCEGICDSSLVNPRALTVATLVEKEEI